MQEQTSTTQDSKETLSSKFLSSNSDVHPSIAELVREIPEGMSRYITSNFKGEQSGVLVIDTKTGKLTSGYCFINYTPYSIIPLESQGGEKYWRINTLNHTLTVMNSGTFESAEIAIAQAQMQYPQYFSNHQP